MWWRFAFSMSGVNNSGSGNKYISVDV